MNINIPRLLLGITLTVWALHLLDLIMVSNVMLGLLALVTGIAYILVAVGLHSGNLNR